MPEHPPPEPAALLEHWMAWERGEATPGQVLADLKRGGMKELLEALATAPDYSG